MTPRVVVKVCFNIVNGSHLLTMGVDLQMVQISLRVLFKPDPDQLPFIYRRLGKGRNLFGELSSI